MIFGGKQVKNGGKPAVTAATAKPLAQAGVNKGLAPQRVAVKRQASSLGSTKAAPLLANPAAVKLLAGKPLNAAAPSSGTVAPDPPLRTQWQDGLILPGNLGSRSPSSSYWW